MNVENLSPAVQTKLLKRLLVHTLPALAYVDLLVLHPVEGLIDFNDRIVLETLLLNEQERTDCTDDDYKKTIALLVYYWKMKGKVAIDFLPEFVRNSIEFVYDAGYNETHPDFNKRVLATLDDELRDKGIPIINTSARNNFEDLFDE